VNGDQGDLGVRRRKRELNCCVCDEDKEVGEEQAKLGSYISIGQGTRRPKKKKGVYKKHPGLASRKDHATLCLT
jgi:hypothetical protein